MQCSPLCKRYFRDTVYQRIGVADSPQACDNYLAAHYTHITAKAAGLLIAHVRLYSANGPGWYISRQGFESLLRGHNTIPEVRNNRRWDTVLHTEGAA